MAVGGAGVTSACSRDDTSTQQSRPSHSKLSPINKLYKSAWRLPPSDRQALPTMSHSLIILDDTHFCHLSPGQVTEVSPVGRSGIW